MIGIITAVLGAIGFIGGNLSEQWQNDQARIHSVRNPQNTTGTYMDYRGVMRDAKTDKRVILSGDGKGNILVKDTYGVTMRVCKSHNAHPAVIKEPEVPYNMRNAKEYTVPIFGDAWQCKDCGAWNCLAIDKMCKGCGKSRTENDRLLIRMKKAADLDKEE